MISLNDSIKLADYCKRNLKLTGIKEDRYTSLPLCVIDAVYSIGVKYESTKAVVNRYVNYADLRKEIKNKIPPCSKQLSISDFISDFKQNGLAKMTNKVFCNRQRTSSISGILKSKAVLMFAETLKCYNVEYIQDVEKVSFSLNFESDIKKIPGQKSGIALKYFFMLAGSESLIKPDRMMSRFTSTVLNRKLSLGEIQEAIMAAHSILANDFPNLTPRRLDHAIWKFQRTQNRR